MDAPPFPAAAIDAARDAVKTHLRIDGNGDDAAVTAAARTALSLGEAFTGTAWIGRDWQQMLPAAAGWQPLTATPVTAIARVEAVDPAGIATPLPAAAYAIDIDARGTGWVRAATRVRVTFAAGMAAGWAELPPPLALGAVLLAAHCLDPRADGAAPPAAVSALWRPWRALRLTIARRTA